MIDPGAHGSAINSTFAWKVDGCPRKASGANGDPVDYDNDGRADLLANGKTLFRFNGSGFDAGINLVGTQPSSSAIARILDANGDGLHDIGFFGGSSWVTRLHNGVGVAPDLLKRVTDGFGNFVEPTYLPLTANPGLYGPIYTKGSGAQLPLVDVQAPAYVVSQYEASTGIASPASYTVSYRYEGARVNVEGRGFVGFQKRTRTDNRSGNQIVTVETSRQDFPYVGSPDRVIVYQPGGTTKISETSYDYDQHVLNASTSTRRVFPYVDGSTEDKYEVGGARNGQHVSRTVSTNSYDLYGNLGGQTVTVTDMGGTSSPLSGATYTTQTVNTYNPNTTYWCLGAATRAVVTSSPYQVTSASRTKSFGIDYQKCRATSETIEPDTAALRVITSYDYYANGQVQYKTISATGLANRRTEYGYHPAGAYVTSETNPLGHEIESEWDIVNGTETARIDVNNKRIEWEYDSFGRKVRESRPDGTRTDYEYLGCSTGCGFPRGAYQIVSKNVAGSVYGQTAAVYDVLGRVLQSTEWLYGGAQSHVLTEYDVMGRAYRRSAPFWTGGSVYWSTTSFDLIGRPTEEQRRVAQDDSSTQTTGWKYEGVRTRQTDAENKEIVKRTNVVGQVVQMTDSGGGHTWYRYDAFGNNTRTYMGDANGTEQAGTAIVAQYDVRGRKENSTDPDMGYWVYNFDPLDQLKSQTDANGKTVSFEYDTLGRMKKRTEQEGITEWFWDTAANGIGMLDYVTAPLGYRETNTYDSLGRLSSKSTIIDGNTYVVSTTFNSAGQVETIEYPQSYPAGFRFKIRYVYDNGLVKRIEDAATNKAYWTGVDTDAAGAIIAETLGNGIGISSWYDSVSGVLRQRDSGPSYSGSIQALTYKWDRVGNLTERRDFNQDATEKFYYDSRYRLDYSTLTTGGSTVTNLDVGYDSLGNITSMSGTGTYEYHPTKKHAVTSTTLNGVTKSYVYDANGNMTSRGGSAIDWYTFNLPKKLRQGSNSSEFFYGPDRDRYKQIMVDSSGTETTVYVGGWLERVTKPSGVIEYKHNIPGSEAAGAIHTRRSNNVHDTRYATKDHLGSIDTISDENGGLLTRLSYDAFGKRRNLTGGAMSVIAAVTHKGFTGHEALDSIELIHMNGRVYDPITGRFISADPLVQQPLFSQSLNRYSYVANNPLSYVDPSGYSWLSKAFKSIGKFLKKYWKPIVAIVAAAFTAGYAWYAYMAQYGAVCVAPSVAATAGAVAGAAGGATFGAVSTALNGGTAGDILKAATIGGIGGAITGGIAGYGGGSLTSRMFAGGLNGGIQTGDVEGFLRGMVGGMIPNDLGFRRAYNSNAWANGALNVASDAVRGYVIDGKDGAKRSVGWGIGNDLVGHGLGFIASGYRAPREFRDGAWHYDVKGLPFGAPAITIGNAISYDQALIAKIDGRYRGYQEFTNDHEPGHVWDQRAFGMAYLPIHGMSQAAFAMTGHSRDRWAFAEVAPFMTRRPYDSWHW